MEVLLELLASALVNSGFEAGVPQLVLPTALARELGFNVEEAPLGEGGTDTGQHLRPP